MIKLGPAVDPALPILVAALQREAAPDAAAGKLLREVRRPAVVPLLLPSLTGGSPAHVRAALRVLDSYGPEARPATAAVMALIPAADVWLEVSALRVLSRCAEPSPELTRLTLAALRARRRHNLAAQLILQRAFKENPASRLLILEALADPAPRIRCAALSTLDEAPYTVAVPALLAALRDPSAAVRGSAYRGLAIHRPPQAIEPLLAALAREREADLIFVLECLGDVPDLAARTRALLASAAERDQLIGAILVTELGDHKDPALAAAVRPLLHSPDDRVRGRAILAADKFRDRHPQTLQALTRLLAASPSVDERRRAAYALASIGPPLQALPALTDMVLDRDSSLVRAAAFALGAMEARAAPAIPALLAQLDCDRASDAISMALSLITGDTTTGLRHALARLATSRSVSVRRRSAELLRGYSSETLRGVIAELAAALRDPDPPVRRAVTAAILSAGGPEAKAPLIAALADPDPGVVACAFEAFEWPRGRADPRVLAALLQAMNRNVGELRPRLFTALWRREKDLALILPQLRAALRDGAIDHRINAAILLRAMDAKAAPAIPELEALASSADPEARRAAAETLRGLRQGFKLDGER